MPLRDEPLLYEADGRPFRPTSTEHSAAVEAATELERVLSAALAELAAKRVGGTPPTKQEIDQVIFDASRKWIASLKKDRQAVGTDYNPWSGELYITIKRDSHNVKAIPIDVYKLLKWAGAIGATAVYAVQSRCGRTASVEPPQPETPRREVPRPEPGEMLAENFGKGLKRNSGKLTAGALTSSAAEAKSARDRSTTPSRGFTDREVSRGGAEAQIDLLLLDLQSKNGIDRRTAIEGLDFVAHSAVESLESHRRNEQKEMRALSMSCAASKKSLRRCLVRYESALKGIAGVATSDPHNDLRIQSIKSIDRLVNHPFWAFSRFDLRYWGELEELGRKFTPAVEFALNQVAICLKNADAAVQMTAGRTLARLKAITQRGRWGRTPTIRLTEQALSVLASATESQIELVSEGAITLLCCSCDPRSICVLAPILRSPRYTESTRVQVAESFGHTRIRCDAHENNDRQVGESLAIGIRDSSLRLRQACAATLRHRKFEEARESLAKALEDSDSAVRRDSAYALASLKDVRAIPALVMVLKDPNDSNWEAARVLGDLGDRRAISPLEECLRTGKDSWNRDTYIAAIRKLDKAHADWLQKTLPPPGIASSLATATSPRPSLFSYAGISYLVTAIGVLACVIGRKFEESLIITLSRNDFLRMKF